MANQQGINLLKQRESLSPVFAELVSHIRLVAVIMTSVLLLFGVSTGLAWTYVSAQSNRLTREKETLSKEILTNRSKLDLLVRIKERVGFIDEIMKSHVPWVSYLETALSIAVPPTLTSLSFNGQKGETMLSVQLASLDEALALTQTIQSIYASGTIRMPKIESFQVEESGGVTMSIAYTSSIQKQ